MAVPAQGVELALIGVFPNKAVVQVNGGAARTLTIGQKTREGITLVSVERDAAVLDIEGSRRTLRLGQQHATQSGSTSANSVTLSADPRGHFVAEGLVNGSPVRFVVDTGASLVTLTAGEARRLGLDYRSGSPIELATANGPASAHRVRLANVRIGDIAVDNVDAVVETQDMPALLGMSFLNRMNMRREGSIMGLTRRY